MTSQWETLTKHLIPIYGPITRYCRGRKEGGGIFPGTIFSIGSTRHKVT